MNKAEWAEAKGRITKAFNHGCQARIMGDSITDNPCKDREGQSWQEGWLHVHNNWGTDARWLVCVLPAVTEPAARKSGRMVNHA